MHQLADEIVARLRATLVQDVLEVVAQLGAREDALVGSHRDVDHRERTGVEVLVVIAREAEDLGDHLHRVAVGELLDELGVAAFGEPVDHPVDDGHDEVLVPVREHPLPERLRDERPQPPVLGLVHPDERVRTHHHAHQLADAPGAERDVVAHDRGDEVVRVDLVRTVGQLGDRRLDPLPVEVRVRIPNVAGDAGELVHRLEGSIHRRGHLSPPEFADVCVTF